MDQITNYDTDERRQGIIDFLCEALGHGHDLVTDLSGCFAAQKQSHKQGDDYCRHYLMCDICNMNRVRLLKGIFYLAYRKGMDDFYSVTITPKEPFQGLNGCC